jgi:hypothetical protein
MACGFFISSSIAEMIILKWLCDLLLADMCFGCVFCLKLK